MKVPINLASQPFRRDRAMIVASIAVSVVLVITLSGLIYLILADRKQLAGVRLDLDRFSRETRSVAAEQAKLDAILRRPENTEVLERSVLLNQLLYRKGISWTKILEDLGKTLPWNVQIINIRPYLNKDNQVSLDMTVGSESQIAIIEFLKALESSTVFQSVAVPSRQAPTQSEPLYRSREVRFSVLAAGHRKWKRDCPDAPPVIRLVADLLEVSASRDFPDEPGPTVVRRDDERVALGSRFDLEIGDRASVNP